MTKMLRLMLALAVSAASLWVAPEARAGDPTCNDIDDDCSIVIVTPGVPAAGQPSEKPKEPKKKVVPRCSAFSGLTVVAPVGTSLSELLPADRPPAGWVRITCLLAGDQMWLWMDPRANAASIARTLLVRLQLEPVKIGWTPTRVGAMGFVGVPTWLWVDDPARVTWGPATISAAGVTLTAKVESITWSMGNGDQVRCANRGTEWQRGMGAEPSPTCGYTYEEQGRYRVTATSHWVARWSGYGRSGTIPLSLSQERTLEVGEIQVIVNR
ncbi:MAG: hypothetical protein WAL91_06255 [Propionicimonas sp.]